MWNRSKTNSLWLHRSPHSFSCTELSLFLQGPALLIWNGAKLFSVPKVSWLSVPWSKFSDWTLVGERRLHLRPPWPNPVWTLAHTNSVFTPFRKRPAAVAVTFSASRGCPLTGALTVPSWIVKWKKKRARGNYGQTWVNKLRPFPS